jgi:TIR domain/PASTA domain
MARVIFVSYRRTDTEGEAGRLFDDLVNHFGETSVFMDVAAIDIGRDFRKAIDESVAACGVLLVVIGKDWIDTKNEGGQRRLDDPSDFVRLETASALKRDIPVIPVLVQGAKMPHAEQLPEDLRELAYRNCVELTHARWPSDFQLLIKGLHPYVEAPAPPIPVPEEDKTNQGEKAPFWKSRKVIVGLILTALVAAVVAAYTLRPGQKGPVNGLNQPSSPDSSGKNIPVVPPVVSAEPAQKKPLVDVPLLVGTSLVTAERRLLDSQLTLGTISPPTRKGLRYSVLSQSPAPGEKAEIGSRVDVVVSEEKPLPKSPSNEPAQAASPFVTISRATCSAAGPNAFRIEMAGEVTVPEGQTRSLSALAGGVRFRPVCKPWGDAGPTDGGPWEASCIHRPNDRPQTAWQATTIVNPRNGQPPIMVFAVMTEGKRMDRSANKPVTCSR